MVEEENKSIPDRLKNIEGILAGDVKPKEKKELKFAFGFGAAVGMIGLVVGGLAGLIIFVNLYYGLYGAIVGWFVLFMIAGMIRGSDKMLFPWQTRLGRVKRRKGWIIGMLIHENRHVEFIRVPSTENTVMVDGAPRVIRPDDIIWFKKKPMVVLPSWSAKPFSPADNYSDTIKDKYLATGFKHLLNRMKTEMIPTKKKFNAWGMLIGIVVLAVVGYLAYKGGLFNG